MLPSFTCRYHPCCLSLIIWSLAPFVSRLHLFGTILCLCTYTVYSCSQFRAMKNVLCSAVVFHLHLLQRMFPWVRWYVRFNVFSFCCPCWIDETLLNHKKLCFVNLLSFVMAEFCSHRHALSICFLHSSTTKTRFAEFAEFLNNKLVLHRNFQTYREFVNTRISSTTWIWLHRDILTCSKPVIIRTVLTVALIRTSEVIVKLKTIPKLSRKNNTFQNTIL